MGRTSGGASWSPPRPIHGAGCARPRLLSLGKAGKAAPLLLSGGRLCTENTTDLSLWVNADGHGGYGAGGGGGAWVKHSLSYWHNKLWRGGNDSVNLFHR